jgi:hypothetical protein
VLFTLCLDQLGVIVMLGSFARAYFGWFNGTIF